MSINRKLILEIFLENICCISDKEYQRRVWIEGKGPECHDYDESLIEFFDDGESIFEDYKDFGTSEKQYQLFPKIS